MGTSFINDGSGKVRIASVELGRVVADLPLSFFQALDPGTTEVTLNLTPSLPQGARLLGGMLSVIERPDGPDMNLSSIPPGGMIPVQISSQTTIALDVYNYAAGFDTLALRYIDEYPLSPAYAFDPRSIWSGGTLQLKSFGLDNTDMSDSVDLSTLTAGHFTFSVFYIAAI